MKEKNWNEERKKDSVSNAADLGAEVPGRPVSSAFLTVSPSGSTAIEHL